MRGFPKGGAGGRWRITAMQSLCVRNVNARFFPSPSLGLSLLGIAITGLVKVILAVVSYLSAPA